MDTVLHALHDAQDTINRALDDVAAHRGKPGVWGALALLDEAETEAHALYERVVQQSNLSVEVDILASGLRTLLTFAADLRAGVEETVYREIGRRMRQEPQPASSFGRVFAAGTIVSCPCCGEGLYKVTKQATTEDLVLDDGTVIQPLNTTVPARTVWTPFACPFCGGRLLRDGKIHTLQHGWV